jgi:transposase-like protein
MLILNQINSLSKRLCSGFVIYRHCPVCNGYGAYKHGFYRRALPDSAVQKVSVPRLLCLNCRKTFSCLPFCLVRRLGISLSDLLRCAASTEPWTTLEETLMIARSTLWRWRRIGKKLLAVMPELLALADDSWIEAAHMISRIQYPPLLSKLHPTQAGN